MFIDEDHQTAPQLMSTKACKAGLPQSNGIF